MADIRILEVDHETPPVDGQVVIYDAAGKVYKPASDIAISGDISCDDITMTGNLVVNGDGSSERMTYKNGATEYTEHGCSGSNGGFFAAKDSSGTITGLIRGYASSLVQAYFTAGRVGIGTASPGASLEVTGDIICDDITCDSLIVDDIYGTASDDLRIRASSGYSLHEYLGSTVFDRLISQQGYATRILGEETTDSRGLVLIGGERVLCSATTPATQQLARIDIGDAQAASGIAFFSGSKTNLPKYNCYVAGWGAYKEVGVNAVLSGLTTVAAFNDGSADLSYSLGRTGAGGLSFRVTRSSGTYYCSCSVILGFH